MQNEWILDVLADLRSFAQQNGLGILAEQLDDTRLVAATELASQAEGLTTNDGTGAGAARGTRTRSAMESITCVWSRHTHTNTTRSIRVARWTLGIPRSI